jgi:hypothetical protein
MPFFSKKKTTTGEYEIYNGRTGQIYSKYSSSDKAQHELLNLRMAYHMGMEDLGNDINKQIEKLTKTHHKKWLKGLLGKKYIIEGGSRKSSTKKYKNNGHKKTRRA